MSEAAKVLYLDLELDPKDRVAEVGALRDQQELRDKGSRLESWIKESRFICGHNVIAHDLPLLRKHLKGDPFAGKAVIDTLLWSPLLFPERPYHKLVKGYHLLNEDAPNDPVADCKLCRDLLKDEVAAFETLAPSIATIYHGLVGQRSGYDGLFQLEQFVPLTDVSLAERIRRDFQGRVCSSVVCAELINERPVELAYALALVTTKKSVSILPEYVVREHPNTREVLEKLRFNACSDPTCTYCVQHLDAKKALGEFFRHDEFRLFRGESVPGVQEGAVRSAISGSSLLAVFPTGGGKSITFQVPALMRGVLTRDLTVVISPLVSLMKDQVDVLMNRHGIVNAAYISGLLSPLERDEAIQKVRDGDVHLLYIAPESLRTPTIFNLLRGRNIARFVVDEAHCLSSWGQDFRVDYLHVADFIKELQKEKAALTPIPISCFTATAKPQVIDDIRRYFKERLDMDLELFVTRAPRENLSYEVIPVNEPEEKFEKLVELLTDNQGPAIVYVSRVKRVRELVEILHKRGFRVAGYYGPMERDEKQRNQQAFMADEVDVMVATSAFGMGVDKEDVKTIIHFNISDSLEAYVQEAGRAGRRSDIEAKCFVLYHESDLAHHFRLHRQSKLNLGQIDQVWRAIKDLTRKRSTINKSALEIAREAGWDMEMKDLETKVKAAIGALEESKYLARKLNYTSVKATSIQVRDITKANQQIKEAVGLTEAQKQHCTGVLKRIITDKECRIDHLADILGTDIRRVQESIDQLRELRILADGKDLTAVVDLSRSKRATRPRARNAMRLEQELLGAFDDVPVTASLKELNQELLNKGSTCTSTELIHSTLLFWKLRGVLRMTRVDKNEELYSFMLVRPVARLKEMMRFRHEVADKCLASLENLAKRRPPAEINAPVTFSLLELKKSIGHDLLNTRRDFLAVESALLYLNHMKALTLEGGFMVFYQRLHIERKEQNNRKQFTQDDYEKLDQFYRNRVEQIHFVGEYAKKRVASYSAALAFVDDYFKLPYDGFLRRYFPNRDSRLEITRTMTAARFKELFGKLSPEQLEIVKEVSPNILVSAGPGSGKTLVMVHKIANLVLMEDVKPDQFLMLTFSKSAALEFRSRVHQLIPEYKGWLKIATFHGFCFDLLGEIGDLERSEGIIKKAIAVLRDGEVSLPSITNKSVLVLDEFQDVTEEEWELVQAIADRVPNLRIVAVGDDDQNIYEWRRASSGHWRAFAERFAPKHFALLTNYRSAPNIVDYNNQLVEQVAGRAKRGEMMEASQKENGSIAVCEYVSPNMIEPLVLDLVQRNDRGSTAVLARRNLDVLLLSAALSAKGVKVRTVHGAEGFRLDMLHEVRQFTALLESAMTRMGTIPKKVWQQTKDHYLQLHTGHPLLRDLSDIIALFEERYGGRYELSEWKDYIRELRMEEAVTVGSDTVLVTTMHKAKGKEFESVFVMLRNEMLETDADRRLFYVACTRAKKHLTVHTDRPVLKKYVALDLNYSHDPQHYPAPTQLEYVAGMKEVNLNSMKLIQDGIGQVSSGAALEAGSSFRLPGDGRAMYFAKRLQEGELSRFESAGYECSSASVEYKVHWYSKEDGREYQVLLPRLLFRKGG